jgi:hypothetical protein
MREGQQTPILPSLANVANKFPFGIFATAFKTGISKNII